MTVNLVKTLPADFCEACESMSCRCDYDPRPHQEMQPMIDYLETRNEVYGGEWYPEDY